MDSLTQVAIKHSVWIKTSPERAWQAVTQPKQLEQWYAPGCPWEIPALKVGETVKFYNTDTDIQLATIEVVDPLRQFTLRWQPDPLYPATALVNAYWFEEQNGGTHVTITQAGYESLPNAIRQQRVAEDDGAYAAVVASLKAYLEGK
jgi:uncharacterized protein YndB with AHSA1/START domain